MKANSHLKVYLKPSRPCFHFAHPIYPLRKPPPPCDAQASIIFSPLDAPRPPIWRGDPYRIRGTQTRASYSIFDMVWIRGGHTDSSLSRNSRPRASSPQDLTSQAPETPTIPSFESGVPLNPPQCRYETRRPSTTPGTTSSRLKSLVHYTPAKRARISGPKESSRPS